MENSILPKELIWAARENNLIIFVGAGLSYNLKNIQGSTLLGWDNLVRQVFLYLKNERYNTKKLTLKLKNKSPIAILDEIEHNGDFPLIKIRQFARDFFLLSENNNLDLHKSLYKLSNIIITTNYDQAFEIANKNIKSIIAGDNASKLLHENLKGKILFKLHGCMTAPSTMVLFPSDYNRLYNAYGIIGNKKDISIAQILLLLQYLIINKNILFLGCGMGDFQINTIFKNIKNILGNELLKHFYIGQKRIDDSLEGFLTPIYIKDFSEIDAIIKFLLYEKGRHTNFQNGRKKRQNKSLCYKHLMNGIGYYYDNNHGSALTEYKKAVLYYSKSSMLWGSWGDVLSDIAENQNDKLLFEESIKKYKRAIKLNPFDSLIFTNYGKALYCLGKLKKDEKILLNSLDKYKKAIKIDPNNSWIWVNAGTVLNTLAEWKNDKKLFEATFKIYHTAVELNKSNAEAYFNWGASLSKLGKTEKSEQLFKESFEKFERASLLKPCDDYILGNWGCALYGLANIKEDADIFKKSITIFEMALKIDERNYDTLNNYGIALYGLAQIKDDNKLYRKSISVFKKLIKLNQNNGDSFYHLGRVLHSLAKLKCDEDLYNQSLDAFRSASLLKSDNDSIYLDWGISLYDLARIRMEEIYLNASCEKFKKVAELNNTNDNAFYYWGMALWDLAKIKKDESLYKICFNKFDISIQIDPHDSVVYCNFGNALVDFAAMTNDKKFCKEGINKYKSAIRIDKKFEKAFDNWGTTLYLLAKLQNNDKRIIRAGISKCKKAHSLNNFNCYNLACGYSLIKQKNDAFRFLKKSLENYEISVEDVLADTDWKHYFNDDGFQRLVSGYSR